MLEDPENLSILEGILSLASAFHRQVIAEGVETEEQLAFLRREQCAEMQGFLYSAPLAPAEFEARLRESARSPAQPDRLRLTFD